MLTRMVLISRDPPASASQSAGITGLSHRAWPHEKLLAVRNMLIPKEGTQSFIRETTLQTRQKYRVLFLWVDTEEADILDAGSWQRVAGVVLRPWWVGAGRVRSSNSSRKQSLFCDRQMLPRPFSLHFDATL